MRPRIDGPSRSASPHTSPTRASSRMILGDTLAVAELFVGVYRRDLLSFFPQTQFELVPGTTRTGDSVGNGPNFGLFEPIGDEPVEVELFNARYRLGPRAGLQFSAHDVRMLRAIGAVLMMRYHHLFHLGMPARLELYRGGSEDHYVAAFVEPQAYTPAAAGPSRIASTIQTLRTAALSTYENHRVSTGALLFGSGRDDAHPAPPTAPDALPYSIELTGLKSIHRLCDGERTLFLVDPAGRLAGIVDVENWARKAETPATAVPCARAYQAHARATETGGHVCLVLSPNQEIKLFASGSQAFAFAHGRWRILDSASKFARWQAELENPGVARTLFQAALNLAEVRRGALFVVLRDPMTAIGRLISPHDCLSVEPSEEPPADLSPRDPLAKRALHYLARGQSVTTVDSAVLEALASLDGALATDSAGRIVSFGAILRNDASELPALMAAEGARTTAALVASRFGPVLKVSEDGIVSCFLDGARVWDL
jgi:hypothetical protein